MKRILFVSLLAIASAAQAKEEPKDVATLAAPCAACHGKTGAEPITPEYPILAGQYANYLEHALKEYKTGKRKNVIMASQVANLSDADILALSRHFAAQKSKLHTPSVHGKDE